MKKFKLLFSFLIIYSAFTQNILGQYKGERDFHSQYFINEAAFNLEGGEIQYSNIMLFYNDLNIGLSNHLSAGISTILLGYFVQSDVPASFRIKFSQSLNKLVHMGAGIKLNTEFNYDNFKHSDFVYEPFAIFTFGSARNNISFQFSVPYQTSIWDKPYYQLNGKLRITKRTALMGEFFFNADNDYQEYASLFGARTYFRKWALEYGAFFENKNAGNHLSSIWPFVGAKFHFN